MTPTMRCVARRQRHPVGTRLALSALRPKLIAAGLYVARLDAGMLRALCGCWATSERARVRHARARVVDRPALATAVAEWRAAARELAARFLLIDERRRHAVVLDAEGRDVELVRIFDPAAPLRLVDLTTPQARCRLTIRATRAHYAGIRPAATSAPSDREDSRRIAVANSRRDRNQGRTP